MPLLTTSAAAAAAVAATATTTATVSRAALAGACATAALLSTAASLVATSAWEHRRKMIPTQRGVPNIPGYEGVSAASLKPGESLCKACKGKQRVTCACCSGRGRVNGGPNGNAVMLPSGEWPQWCPACRGGGLEVCALCLGEGVRRRFGGY